MHGNVNVEFCQQLKLIYRQITQRLLNSKLEKCGAEKLSCAAK